MKTAKSFTPWKWLNLLVFEIFGAALCLLLSLMIKRLFPYRSEEIAGMAQPCVASYLVSVWTVMSVVAFDHYRKGMGFGLHH